MTAPCLVVGAGPTGLGCTVELATARPVELIDRIPVPGGEAGWSAPRSPRSHPTPAAAASGSAWETPHCAGSAAACS